MISHLPKAAQLASSGGEYALPSPLPPHVMHFVRFPTFQTPEEVLHEWVKMNGHTRPLLGRRKEPPWKLTSWHVGGEAQPAGADGARRQMLMQCDFSICFPA